MAARAGEPAWDSEFGSGRPGWHVECAAIATEYLGVSFDIQAGGTDLAFPHHEMSASHARVALGSAGGSSGPVFARSYVHAGMVRLDGEKMSKSRGNLVFVSGLLAAGVDPMAIRLAILAHHYAGDWDWTDEGLTAADARLARWRRAVAVTGGSPRSSGAGTPGAVPGTVPGRRRRWFPGRRRRWFPGRRRRWFLRRRRRWFPGRRRRWFPGRRRRWFPGRRRRRRRFSLLCGNASLMTLMLPARSR